MTAASSRAWDDWMKALSGGAAWAPRESVAHRLAQWLDWTDAIALASVLDARGPQEPPPAAAKPSARRHNAAAPRPLPAAQSLAQGRQRICDAVQQLVKDAVSDWARDPSDARDPAVLRRAVAQAQRQMDTSVSGLRSVLRHRLLGGTAAQRELAAIDAVLEHALADRQRHFLSGAPARLAHPSLLGENADPAAVERRLMQALAAELELRLQPLQGLVQALPHTANPNP